MEKTTVYLPAELKAALKRTAKRRRISEAEVIRAALQAAVAHDKPAPCGGFLDSDDLRSDRVDEHLVGFGER